MFRPAFALALALLLPFAAAAGAASGVFGSVEEFARAAGLKHGGWHTSLKIAAAEVEVLPGADPAFAAEIKARTESQVGRVDESDECFGPASDPSPVLPGFVIEPQCSFSRLEAADGRWAMDASCPKPERQGTGRIVAEGTYSLEAVTGRHEVHLSARGVIVHAKIETVSRFTGGCRVVTPAPPRPKAD